MRTIHARRRAANVRGAMRMLATGVLAAAALVFCAVPAAAGTANPGWPARCPQRVVIVLDLSSSIDPYLPEIKKSARDLVDALRGTSNEVAVVTFGSVATLAAPLMNAGDEGQRSTLKSLIDGVALTAGDGGGTNWQGGLSEAAALDPGVVLFLTDGQPTVTGGPTTGYTGGGDSLTPAVQIADRMRSNGTRIVGLGMGLEPRFVPNLVQVTGPSAGDDYYETGSDASGLLDKLYDIAGKTCGVPVAALPQPEGGTFPLLPVIGGVVTAVLLAVIGGFWMRKPSPTSALPSVSRRTGRLKDTSIRLDEVRPTRSDVTPGTKDEPMIETTAAEPPPAAPPAPGRSMSLDWLDQDSAGPADRHGGGS